MIGKALFIDSIEAIRLQMAYDTAKAEAMSNVLNIDEVTIPLYDNSMLIKAIINLLRVSFPKDATGFCEIDHYCFDMNFGKISEEEVITPEDLWNRLSDEKSNKSLVEISSYMSEYNPVCQDSQPMIVSTHPLIDDNPTKKPKVY
jgi:hypothetical protein